MEVEIILGRPGAGKTERLIRLLNNHPGPGLFVSFENLPEILSERGLNETVTLFVPDEPECVTVETVVEKSKKVKATLVAIENLEVVPRQIELGALRDALEEVGVEHLILSSHLRCDGVCASKGRINTIKAKHTVVAEYLAPLD